MLGIMLMKSLLKISPFPCHSPSSGPDRTIWTPGGRGWHPKNNPGENTWDTRGPARGDRNYFESLWLDETWKKSWTGQANLGDKISKSWTLLALPGRKWWIPEWACCPLGAGVTADFHGAGVAFETGNFLCFPLKILSFKKGHSRNQKSLCLKWGLQWNSWYKSTFSCARGLNRNLRWWNYKEREEINKISPFFQIEYSPPAPISELLIAVFGGGGLWKRATWDEMKDRYPTARMT